VLQKLGVDANYLIIGPSLIKRTWKNELKQFNLPEGRTIHYCRHIAASILAQGGAAITVIMANLNHKNPINSLAQFTPKH
jgi:integrase